MFSHYIVFAIYYVLLDARTIQITIEEVTCGAHSRLQLDLKTCSAHFMLQLKLSYSTKTLFLAEFGFLSVKKINYNYWNENVSITL